MALFVDAESAMRRPVYTDSKCKEYTMQSPVPLKSGWVTDWGG